MEPFDSQLALSMLPMFKTANLVQLFLTLITATDINNHIVNYQYVNHYKMYSSLAVGTGYLQTFKVGFAALL